MERTLTAAALLLLAGTAGAQVGVVYQCTGSDGHISLQSQPCGPDQTIDRAAVYQPQKFTAAQKQAMLRRNVAPARQVTGGGEATVIRNQPGGTASACARARAARDREYRNNPKMGYQGRQSWGEYVRRACKW